MSLPDALRRKLEKGAGLEIGNVLDGYEPFLLADIARTRGGKRPVVFVLRDGNRMGELEDALRFVAPELPVLTLPGLGLPALRPRRALGRGGGTPTFGDGRALGAEARAAPRADPDDGERADPEDAAGRGPRRGDGGGACRQPHRHGGHRPHAAARRLRAGRDGARARRVRRARRHPRPLRAGRGGAGAARLLRRHAGDDPQLRSGDPAHDAAAARASSWRRCRRSRSATRRSAGSATNYVRRFGAAERGDALYASISEGKRFSGMEHWLPLFYERLDTLFDYLRRLPDGARPPGAGIRSPSGARRSPTTTRPASAAPARRARRRCRTIRSSRTISTCRRTI